MSRGLARQGGDHRVRRCGMRSGILSHGSYLAVDADWLLADGEIEIESPRLQVASKADNGAVGTIGVEGKIETEEEKNVKFEIQKLEVLPS